MLYIFGGLPGTGKSTLSKYLAMSVNATYLRIDTIEQKLRDSGFNDLWDQGYQIAFELASENLAMGGSVVADSTNPVPASRKAWLEVATKTRSPYLEIEVICSDKIEHKNRIENRQSNIQNLVLPDWKNVISREYHRWDSASIVLDTAGKTIEQSREELADLLRKNLKK